MVLLLLDQAGKRLANHPCSRQQGHQNVTDQSDFMKRGLYRTIDSFLGECAQVHEDAGDAFPFLLREIYDTLGFSPAYDDLPFREKPSGRARDHLPLAF